jgi:hypothetical protein
MGDNRGICRDVPSQLFIVRSRHDVEALDTRISQGEHDS